MNASIPLFIDESTVRFCPTEQIERIVEVRGYDGFINEEVICGVGHLECANWIQSQLADKRLTRHQIVDKDDIRLLLQVSKRCGACRSEVCSYIAAKRASGIVITKDPVARKLLLSHFPEVSAFGPEEFLLGQKRTYQQESLSDRRAIMPSSITANSFKTVDVD